MRSILLAVPLTLLVLALSGCDASGPPGSAPASAAPADPADRLDRLEERLVAENRKLRDEIAKLIQQQQELSRNHLEEVASDLQFQMGKLLQRITRLETHVVELMARQERGAPPPAEEAARDKLYTPEMRQEIAKQLADRGIVLRDDRVEVAGIVGPGREAPLEYFAVLRGGKEHEAVIVVTGSYGKDERLPKGLAAGLNLACQALNLPRGTPTRYLDGGESVPAAGDPVHLYVEWQQDGKTVRARAEDLVYNERTNRAMDPDTWIYVGSRFLFNVGTGQRDFMAELTGSIAATFGCDNSIIANKEPEATDVNQSNFFRGYTPRLPPLETPVTLVISKDPLEANATFKE
jgi:hypothetical protein